VTATPRSRKPKAAATPRTPKSKAARKPKSEKSKSVLSAGMRGMLVRFLREDVTAVLLIGQQPEAPSMEARDVPSVRAVFPRDRRVGLDEKVVETIGDVDALVEARALVAETPQDGASWRKLLLSLMPAATLDALADVIACEDLRVHRGSPISTIGHLLSVAIRRRILRYALESANWKLSEVAKELQLGGTGNLLRTIKEVGLEPELERARADGRVQRGGDRKSASARNKVIR
jgi:hypothetical protein